ncbi:recombinase family protein [Caenibius sp. WL]|nr:recombinase family protein [Caenibius sp. WL]
MASSPARRRCAVYTRKSTEEGLEQAFNSLDAQREACAAYVLSQRHEGWMLLPDLYDDGGYTGSNMDRPGLQQLLADVRNGKIDVIVVYKVDRLTRSLADFAKIVEVLDASGASFVSVTQAFNTTNSMGRLTLNVLLSFAQFEREVIAERIRDKVAASKARGMWMGGSLPLGYTAIDKKLVIVPDEAATVRHIMGRYLASSSVRELLVELRRDGVVSKRVLKRNGGTRGGVPFSRGAVYHLLANRVYVGEIVHHGKIYAGEHEAIVDRELFDAVQARLAERTNPRNPQYARRCISLLAGMIQDEQGRPMSPTHTLKQGKRYSYYASHKGDGSSEPAFRLPAVNLDDAVKTELRSLLIDLPRIRELGHHLPASQQVKFITSCSALAHSIEAMSTAEFRGLLQKLDLMVTVSKGEISIVLNITNLLKQFNLDTKSEPNQMVTLSIRTSSATWGHETRLRLDPPQGTITPRDTSLMELIARSFAARDQLLAMTHEDVIAMPTTRLRHIERTARLAYLAPDIVRAIMDGKHPRQITRRYLSRIGSLPLCWTKQRAMLGFPAT